MSKGTSSKVAVKTVPSKEELPEFLHLGLDLLEDEDKREGTFTLLVDLLDDCLNSFKVTRDFIEVSDNLGVEAQVLAKELRDSYREHFFSNIRNLKDPLVKIFSYELLSATLSSPGYLPSSVGSSREEKRASKSLDTFIYSKLTDKARLEGISPVQDVPYLIGIADKDQGLCLDYIYALSLGYSLVSTNFENLYVRKIAPVKSSDSPSWGVRPSLRYRTMQEFDRAYLKICRDALSDSSSGLNTSWSFRYLDEGRRKPRSERYQYLSFGTKEEEIFTVLPNRATKDKALDIEEEIYKDLSRGALAGAPEPYLYGGNLYLISPFIRKLLEDSSSDYAPEIYQNLVFRLLRPMKSIADWKTQLRFGGYSTSSVYYRAKQADVLSLTFYSYYTLFRLEGISKQGNLVKDLMASIISHYLEDPDLAGYDVDYYRHLDYKTLLPLMKLLRDEVLYKDDSEELREILKEGPGAIHLLLSALISQT